MRKMRSVELTSHADQPAFARSCGWAWKLTLAISSNPTSRECRSARKLLNWTPGLPWSFHYFVLPKNHGICSRLFQLVCPSLVRQIQRPMAVTHLITCYTSKKYIWNILKSFEHSKENGTKWPNVKICIALMPSWSHFFIVSASPKSQQFLLQAKRVGHGPCL